MAVSHHRHHLRSHFRDSASPRTPTGARVPYRGALCPDGLAAIRQLEQLPAEKPGFYVAARRGRAAAVGSKPIKPIGVSPFEEDAEVLVEERVGVEDDRAPQDIHGPPPLRSTSSLAALGVLAQDGVRVRAAAGAGSFRRRSRLEELAAAATARVARLRQELGQRSGAGNRADNRGGQAAQQRAARERAARVEAALNGSASSKPSARAARRPTRSRRPSKRRARLDQRYPNGP